MLERVARLPDFDYEGSNEAEDRPGALMLLAGRVIRNPGRAIAILVSVGATGVIVANAAFFQTGEHPSPLFATRTGAAPSTAVAAATGIPEDEDLAAATSDGEDLTRLVRTTSVEPAPVEAPAASAAVSQAQQLLTDLGYRPGAPDGLLGAQTRSAVESFERDSELPVTGEVSESLLVALRTAATAESETTAALPVSDEARFRAVQTALNEIGYGPVAVTGAAGGDMADAVRRFQLDNGLAITGRVDDAVVEKMVAIGAMDPL